MNTMNFNNTISKISLLTFIFLSWFSEAGTTVIAEVENTHAIPDNILLSPKNLETAQNETVATATLETEIIAQINRARENPSDYADWLETQKQYYDGIMLRLPGEKPVRTNKGLQALEEAIDFVRKQTPLNPLTYSEAMAIAAQEQLTPIANADTENRGDSRLQNIIYGKVTAEAIVMQLVVDDGFRDRPHRLAIFNQDNQLTGVSCQENSVYEQICAIIYDVNPEDVLAQLSSTSSPVTESSSEITAEPETENTPDSKETTTQETNQEAISTPENPSVEENVIEPVIEDENVTPSAYNTQPNNSLLIDNVERGLLEEGDKVIPNDGSFYDSYPLTGKEGESFIISLESSDFDTFLAIMDDEGNVLQQNDDISDDNNNSQLRVTIPRDGTYSLIVNAYDKEGKGEYTLTIIRR